MNQIIELLKSDDSRTVCIWYWRHREDNLGEESR